MTIQIAEIDVNLNLPVDVRAKIATNLGDPATVEGAAVATSIGGGILRGADGKNYRIISGPLRNDGAGWFAIDDAGHSPVGIDSVSVNGSGHLVVNYASLGANFVVFASCWPDETLALNGFTAGASVGVAETTLKIYQDTPHRPPISITIPGLQRGNGLPRAQFLALSPTPHPPGNSSSTTILSRLVPRRHSGSGPRWSLQCEGWKLVAQQH